VADGLYQFGVELLADCSDHLPALFTLRTPDPDLHQLVMFKRQVEFPQDGRAQSGITDADHGLQGVAAAAQFASGFFRQ